MNSVQGNRLIYLDNLRALMIVLMVAGHAVHPYKLDGGQFTAFPDQTHTAFYNIIAELGMTFRMPMLFFLSGYFITHALARKPMRQVMLDRTFRLGVPFLVGMLTVSPLAVLIKATLGDHQSITHVNEIIPFVWDKFRQGELTQHLWFLSLLLLLNLFTAKLSAYTNRLKQINHLCCTNLPALLGTLFIACMVFATLVHHAWGKFQFFRLPPFFSVFAMPSACNLSAYCLGILIYSNQALDYLPTHFKKQYLIIPCLICLLHYVVWSFCFYSHPEAYWPASLLYGFSQALSNFCMISFFLVIARSTLNREFYLLAEIRKHAFAIFWIHFPIVHLMHASLAHAAMPHFLKFCLVIVASLGGGVFIKRLCTAIYSFAE